MFKVIRENVPQQHFYMICDCPCGQLIQMVFDPEQPEQPQQANFIQQAIGQGWKVGLDRQICPIHAQAERKEQPMVLLPNGRVQLPPMHFKPRG